MHTLNCGMWGLIPWPGMGPRPPENGDLATGPPPGHTICVYLELYKLEVKYECFRIKIKWSTGLHSFCVGSRWEFIHCSLRLLAGFSGSSAGKESTCNARDPGSIPGSGRFPGEGLGYPLQYSWASLVAQTVKNPPAMQETRVWSLGWEDPLEEGMATHSSVLAWRILMDRVP